MSNKNIALTTTLVATDYVDRSGHRGRPQKHPQFSIDLSGVADLVEAHGEKKVRNEAFRDVRAQLGVESKVPMVQHPKNDAIWILKTPLEGRQNYGVVVTPGEVAAPEAEVTAEG